MSKFPEFSMTCQTRWIISGLTRYNLAFRVLGLTWSMSFRDFRSKLWNTIFFKRNTIFWISIKSVYFPLRKSSLQSKHVWFWSSHENCQKIRAPRFQTKVGIISNAKQEEKKAPVHFGGFKVRTTRPWPKSFAVNFKSIFQNQVSPVFTKYCSLSFWKK